MSNYVLDTSVIIDLHRGSLLEFLFRLGHTLVVPDLLFQKELESWIGANLLKLGLLALPVDARGVALAQEYARRRRSLSTHDSLALALAKRKRYGLLAGDRDLRELCGEVSVQCNGVLAVFDWIETAGLTSLPSLYSSLLGISQHNRARLPSDEVAERLARYNQPRSPGSGGAAELSPQQKKPTSKSSTSKTDQ